MSVLAYLERYAELQQFYDGLKNKEEFSEHFLNVMGKYNELANLYADKLSKNSYLTKEELSTYSYSLLKLEKYPEVMSVLKKYYDNPMLVDGTIIVNYLFAKKNSDRSYESKAKTKLKEKILEQKYANYSNIEKLGAYCVMNDQKEVVSYLMKVVKEDPLAKYSIKEWPIMIPFLHDEKVKKLLKPNPKRT